MKLLTKGICLMLACFSISASVEKEPGLKNIQKPNPPSQAQNSADAEKKKSQKAVQDLDRAMFSPKTDLWKHVQGEKANLDKRAAKMSIPDSSKLPSEVKLVSALPMGDNIRIYGRYYNVVLSNLPPLIVDNQYLKGQPLVTDDKGNFVSDEEIIYKALITREIRQYFNGLNLQKLSANFLVAANSTNDMKNYLLAANIMGIAQKAISTVLSHYITKTPYSPSDLVDSSTARAIIAFMAVTELGRYSDQLRTTANYLKTMNPQSLGYEDASLCYTMFTDSIFRVQPISKFAKSTFPDEKFLGLDTFASDLIDALLGKVADNLPGVDQNISIWTLKQSISTGTEMMSLFDLVAESSKYVTSIVTYANESSAHKEYVAVDYIYVETKLITKAQALLAAGTNKPSTPATACSFFPGNVVFRDDFESYPIGTMPSSWEKHFGNNWTPGVVSSKISFCGRNSVLLTGPLYSAIMRPWTWPKQGRYAVSAWFYDSTSRPSRRLWFTYGYGGIDPQYKATPTIYIELRGSGGSITEQPDPITGIKPGKWHHLLALLDFDKNTIDFYAGVEKNQPGTLLQNQMPFKLAEVNILELESGYNYGTENYVDDVEICRLK